MFSTFGLEPSMLGFSKKKTPSLRRDSAILELGLARMIFLTSDRTRTITTSHPPRKEDFYPLHAISLSRLLATFGFGQNFNI
ncbi:hypothetical protein FRC03_005869 [Tulasnella sp. 419]|nr:hypothetical protein FRC03_005869 [Tulasnella sp. 419]